MEQFNWAQKHLEALENASKPDRFAKEGRPEESRAERRERERERERSERKQLKKAAKV